MAIHLSQLTKNFGNHCLFRDLNAHISQGEKVALIGDNGTGKSTLLHILAGLEPASAGQCRCRGSISLLSQQIPDNPTKTLLETIMPQHIQHKLELLRAAEQALLTPNPAVLERYAHAEEAFRLADGYTIEQQAQTLLSQFGLPEKVKLAQLSGGQQRRVMLCRLLLGDADILLLDEPANHLDSEGRKWLVQWIQQSAKTIVLVSHDRHVLNQCVTRVLELERGQLHSYAGNYQQAMAQKQQLYDAHERDYVAYQHKVKALSQAKNRLKSRAQSAGKWNSQRMRDGDISLAKFKAENASSTLAKQARGIEKRLDRLEPVSQPFINRERLRVPLDSNPHSPQDVVILQDFGVARGKRQLISNLSFTLKRGDKLALLGANGTGKSSLIAAILGNSQGVTGLCRIAQGVRVYQLLQHGQELAEDQTCLQALQGANAGLKAADIYYLLVQLGIKRPPETPISQLSGGQHTRLSLACLAVTSANLLILDEPSNHLDIAMITLLEDILQNFQGSLIFSSHDHALVQRVATHRLELPSHRVERARDKGIA